MTETILPRLRVAKAIRLGLTDQAVAQAKDNLPWGCGWVFALGQCAVDSCWRSEPCRGKVAEGICP
jgi:hypothetical protein